MTIAIDEKGTIREINPGMNDIEEGLGFTPVSRDDEWPYKELIEKNIKAMLESPLTPIDLKRQIVEAQETAHNIVRNRGWSSGPKLFIKEDPQRAATSLVDGGAFYTLLYEMPGLSLKFRAKKSGKQDKFERSRRVQEYLMTLQEAGFLRGPKINITSYNDEKLESKLSVEPYVEHDRLTDVLRRAETDAEKGEILRKHILDSLEISRVMTAYSKMKDEKGDYFLRKNYSWTDFVRNFLPGNYIVDSQDAMTQFLNGFALRAVPGLQQKVTKKGKLSKGGLRQEPLLENLRKAFNSEFNSFYRERSKHIVNTDTHTGNILVDSIHGDTVHCDFEHTYFDLLEDPIAELVLTSGIQDREVIKDLVDNAFEKYKAEINVSKEQFYATFQRRLIEKTLTRATRFLDLSQRFSGKDRKNLEDQANMFYSQALRSMKELDLKQTASAVEAYNEKYLKLKRTSMRSNVDGTLASLVSGVTSPKTRDAPITRPKEARRAFRFAYRTAIITACASAAIFGLRNCKNLTVESEPISWLQQIDYTDNQLNIVMPTVDMYKQVPDSALTKVDLNQMDPRQIARKVFQTDDNALIDSLIRAYAPSDPKSLRKSRIEWIFDQVERRRSSDADLLRAIHYASKEMYKDKQGVKPGAFGTMLWPAKNNIYLRERIRLGEAQHQDNHGLDVHIAGRIMLDNMKASINDGKVRIATAVAGYVSGLYNLGEAQIDAGSRSYGEFRRKMDPDDREATDRILIGYLALKDALPKVGIKYGIAKN